MATWRQGEYCHYSCFVFFFFMLYIRIRWEVCSHISFFLLTSDTLHMQNSRMQSIDLFPLSSAYVPLFNRIFVG
jgi:hypothetical protein